MAQEAWLRQVRCAGRQEGVTEEGEDEVATPRGCRQGDVVPGSVEESLEGELGGGAIDVDRGVTVPLNCSTPSA